MIGAQFIQARVLEKIEPFCFDQEVINVRVSADFWKIREASLSWNLPVKWFGFMKNAVKGVSLTVSGRNLFMFLPKTNEWTDPEFSNNTGNAGGVTGFEALPATRIFGASINVQL